MVDKDWFISYIINSLLLYSICKEGLTMFYLALVLLIVHFWLLTTAAKSSGKESVIRYISGILVGGVIIWMSIDSMSMMSSLK